MNRLTIITLVLSMFLLCCATSIAFFTLGALAVLNGTLGQYELMGFNLSRIAVGVALAIRVLVNTIITNPPEWLLFIERRVDVVLFFTSLFLITYILFM